MLNNFLKDYFSYSRRERNGIIILLAIILIIILLYLLLPFVSINQDFNYEAYESKLKEFEKSLKPENKKRQYYLKKNSIINFESKDELSGTNPEIKSIFNNYGISDEEYACNTATEYYKKVNINKADWNTISELLGIEDLISERIIKYRNLLGGFTGKNQFNEVYGIKDNQYNLIASNVFIDTTLIRKININNTDVQTLGRHPYLNNYYAKAIITYKNYAGEIKNINELFVNNILPENIYCRIKPYLSVN